VGSAVVEVSGPDAARWAAELHGRLAVAAEPGESVSPVEVRRSDELVIAVIGLVFAGVGTAKTIWDWWQARRPAGTTVRVVFGDGTRVDVSTAGQDGLEIVFQRAESQQH
jgi:hypothetical protein